jgi:hypothetical protein
MYALIALFCTVASIVRAPPVFVSPVPSSDVNVEPLMIRFVVEAVVNDPYVVDEKLKVCSGPHVFAVVVPNARDTILDDSCRGYVNVRGEAPVPEKHVPLTAKHPPVILIPFAKLDVAVVEVMLSR